MRRFVSHFVACCFFSTAAFITSVWADDPGEGEEGGGETTINNLCTNSSDECKKNGTWNTGLLNACDNDIIEPCGTGIAPASRCDCVDSATSTPDDTVCYCKAS